MEFARTVAKWSWGVEQLKELKPFFRAQARIELRCTNRFKQPRGIALLRLAMDRWFKHVGAAASAVSESLTKADRLSALRAELAQRQAGSDAMLLAALPTLVALLESGSLDAGERNALAQQAYEVAIANGVQGEAKAWFLMLSMKTYDTAWNGKRESQYQRELTQMLTDPVIASDAVAEAALRVVLFDRLNARSRKADGKAILEPLVASRRLDKADQYRVGALIRMANLEYAEGNLDSARQHFEQSGITAQQCALVDAKPLETRGVATGNFPQEALRWGLGGWTLTEFDISPEGTPVNVRTTAAFPPFVFGENAESRVKTSRYQQTYRPGSAQGCVGSVITVNYNAR